jgi:hypothetical protein
VRWPESGLSLSGHRLLLITVQPFRRSIFAKSRAERLFVLNYKDRSGDAPSFIRLGYHRIAGIPHGFARARQQNLKSGTMAPRAADVDCAAMTPDNAVDGGETQAPASEFGPENDSLNGDREFLLIACLGSAGLRC